METKTLTRRVGYVLYATLHNITIEAVVQRLRDNTSGEEEPHTDTDLEGHETELASTRFKRVTLYCHKHAGILWNYL